MSNDALRRIPATRALDVPGERRVSVEMGPYPSVGSHGHMQAASLAKLSKRDRSFVQHPSHRSVGTEMTARLQVVQEGTRVVDCEIRAAAPGADLSDFDDAPRDAHIDQPLIQGCESSPQICMEMRGPLPVRLIRGRGR